MQLLESVTTLPREILAAARSRPERGVTLLDRRGRATSRRSWVELLENAALVARRMAGLGVGPGDRVIVCLPTSQDWFDAWFGAAVRGAWPVSMSPQAATDGGHLSSRRIDAVLSTVDPALVVGVPAFVEKLAGRIQAVTPEQLSRAPEQDATAPDVAPEETAFLQLTSGSTGVPRAVQISHLAAVHNAHAVDEGAGAPWGCRISERAECWVSWLPLHHDMGLVSVLSMMCNGLDLYLMPSNTFLGRPKIWLEHLSAHGNSVAVAPNFGYQMCVERLTPDDVAGFDLSRWQVALSAAEMVRSDTVSAFVDRFAGNGFLASSFRPGYGLAEATVAVTMDRAGKGARVLPMPSGSGGGSGLSDVVSVGPPVMDTAVSITRPDGTLMGAGEVGEVRVQGPGVFSGYYRDAAATAENLVDGWLRTGDRGFLDDGELFIVGRDKDLLIVRGQNIMPHEIEWLAEEEVGGGGALRAAAFSITRDATGEEIVVAVETEAKDPAAVSALVEAVRSRIGRDIGLPLADVIPLRRGRLPRTTSGKVRREELRRRYLEQELERLGTA